MENKQINVMDAIHHVYTEADFDENDHVLFVEKLHSLYPKNEKLYDEIIEILISYINLDFKTKLYETFQNKNCEFAEFYNFGFYIIYNDVEIHYTVRSGKLIFVGSEEDAYNKSDFIKNLDWKKFDLKDSEYFERDEINETIEWDRLGDGTFSEDYVSDEYSGTAFNSINFKQIVKNYIQR